MSVSEKAFETYQRTLDLLRRRKRGAAALFPNHKDNEFLQYLARFCRVGKTPYHPDIRKTDITIGRQEVWLLIQNYLKLPPDEIYEIYNKSQQ